MTGTPAIDSGSWKARNMPALPRTSGAHPVTSSPLKRIAPAGDLVGGVAEEHVGQRRLARTVRPHQGVDLARVDGRSTPFRIGDPSAEAWRSAIWRSGATVRGRVGLWARPNLSLIRILSYENRANRTGRPAGRHRLLMSPGEPVRLAHGRPVELRRPGGPTRLEPRRRDPGRRVHLRHQRPAPATSSRAAAQGLFVRDTRVLSRFELLVNGATTEPLTAVTDNPFSATFVSRCLPAGRSGGLDADRLPLPLRRTGDAGGPRHPQLR